MIRLTILLDIDTDDPQEAYRALLRSAAGLGGPLSLGWESLEAWAEGSSSAVDLQAVADIVLAEPEFREPAS